MELPEEFTQQMQVLLGEEYSDYLACFDEPRYYGLRVNTKKISVEDFVKISPFPIEPIPWISNGFYYDGAQISPAKHPYYYAGLYYLQEPSAMTPANRLPISPGDKVLDICAAPGGKATELGAKLNGSGLLAANDISNSRARGLLKNLEVFGIDNTIILCQEPGKLESYFPSYFDKILIDAPCSGEGMFRKEPKMVGAYRQHGPAYYANLQKSIIREAAVLLKPGGLMMYSTCTFNLQEDEQIIADFLETNPEFSVVPISPYEGFSPGRPDLIDVDPSLCETVRIYPHRMRGEGHYLALLRKKEEGKKMTADHTGKPSDGQIRALPEELKDFLSGISRTFDPNRILIREGKVYYMPEGLPELKGLRLLRTGLFLGELKTRRFEPSQALAMSLTSAEFDQILLLSSDDERVIKYLKGETIDAGGIYGTSGRGWVLICVDGFPLGFGKVSGGIIKNKYLRGWRMTS